MVKKGKEKESGPVEDVQYNSGAIPYSYVAAAVLVLGVGLYYKFNGSAWLKPRSDDLKPLKAPRMLELSELTDSEYKNSMLWGSYRSGLYFGMRTRSQQSLLTGLMWFDPDNPETLKRYKVRHHASQEDRLQTYGWLRHDGRSYGRQQIVDEDYNITVSMMKQASEDSGTGGDWAVRVSASKVAGRGAPRKRISFVMYLGDEETPRPPGWNVMPEGEALDLREGSTLANGVNGVVGPWSLHAVEVNSTRKAPSRLDFLALPTDGKYEYILQAKELMLGVMYEHLERNPTSDKFQLYLPNGATTGSNLALFQVTMILPGTVDFVFLSHKKGVDPALIDSSSRIQDLSGEALTLLLQQKDIAFDDKFEKEFLHPDAHPLEENTLEVAKAALSNLLGSMGYFYGTSQVRQPGGVTESYWPAALYTAVPSRSFFPRGFLWDEGFHQLLVQRWDPQLSRDVLAHWLDLINSKGWIPREQILGLDAKARVPEEFIVQDPRDANPPSLFLPIMAMAEQIKNAKKGDEDPEVPAVKQFLQRAWPRLAAWYQWFNTTQAGPMPTSYRWHGRNATTLLELNPKTLTSGLDDYPRASHPSKEERHLDLRCWMALASEAMATIAETLELPGKSYRSTAEVLRDPVLLAELHLDQSTGHYLDYGLHSEDVSLQRKHYPVQGKVQEVTYRVVNTPPTPRLVPCFGYVSLFPLLMKLLSAESKELGRQLQLLTDPQLLWTPFGLRSVSPTCSLYKKHNTVHDPPYWRGQIWININYLALQALEHYKNLEGPHAETARQAHAGLRQAILSAVEAQYTARGYLFEQYDDSTGRGISSHPFTGWTALVALVAAGSQ